MNLFDQYGIKEVADVTIYSIHKKEDGSGEVYYVPALYLDTLKVSTTEKTAENTWAQGGLGNSRLISWDYGKQINVTLEDALCTPASLGLCWNGILSADWKNGHLDYQTDVCECKNPLTKISRMEKAFYPRSNRTVISNLLPKIKEDTVDDYFDLLKISSVVDGTDIRGFGTVKNKSYKWKMAIESAVKSIAVVPDRFFDIRGKAYPIDWERKVSVHSLPDYENYRDAIIYRINNKGKFQVPPLAKIIFDEAMEDLGTLVTVNIETDAELSTEENPTAPTITLASLFKKKGYKVYENGVIKETISETDDTPAQDIFYIPLRNLSTEITGINGTYTFQVPDEDSSETTHEELKSGYKYVSEEILYKINENSELANKLKTITLTEFVEDVGTTLTRYLWNHKVDFMKNDGATETIHRADAVYSIDKADYLAIIVDNNNNYIPLVGRVVDTSMTDSDNNPLYGYNGTDTGESEPNGKVVVWFDPCPDVDVSQFKGLDMWLRFQSINEMIYFLITKYEDNIIKIQSSKIHTKDNWGVNKETTKVTPDENLEAEKVEGKLWAYINPRTMLPYDDDYWFHLGEPYYVKSLTLAPAGKKIKGLKIVVKADQWPGMYMVVGETYIRSRDTGEDERMLLRFPLCKVKSDHTLTLEAEGDPTTFNLDLEVAKPPSGNLIEITTYETGTKMIEGDNGCFYAVDGSSEVIVE